MQPASKSEAAHANYANPTSCYIEHLFTKKQFEFRMLKFYLQTEQMKGLMKELFKTLFNLQS